MTDNPPLGTALQDINIRSIDRMLSPQSLHAALPVSQAAFATVERSRQQVKDIIDGRDSRLLVIVGPCSIHDPELAMEYARRLHGLAGRVRDTMFVVMRVYFEKPRTTVGWKGLINDPDLDGSFRIERGLHLARRLLLDLAELGVPAANEALDPVVPQFLQDLISWSAIGARTTESQTHREMASGLSCAVGFKNGTDGSLAVAINALQAVSRPHSFLGLSHDGQVAVVNSRGNAHAHLVLRGGEGRQNYDSVSVAQAIARLREAKIRPNIMVDCSHANSRKDHRLQPLVLSDVVSQLAAEKSIMGVMLESNINAGNQSIPKDLSDLKYGVSLTDACMDWQTTEDALLSAAQTLRAATNG